MFVPYSILFNIHSHRPEVENPGSYDECETGFNDLSLYYITYFIVFPIGIFKLDLNV